MSRLPRIGLAVVVLAAGCGKSRERNDTSGATARSDKGDGVGSGDLFGGGGDAAPLGLDPHGMIDPGELEATAEVDKGALTKVVRANVPKLQLCYEQALLANPGIEGKIVVTFTVGIEGAVDDVSASGVHPDVETCVAEKFRSFKFPRLSANKVEVRYPFTFRR